ncbi:ubiquitin carboxyl-terminal hydrolase 12-like, partial [Morus notabilis]
MGDSSSCRFKWTIESFTKLSVRKLYSDIFYVGGYKWRILIFPKGNNVDHLSMYLDVADSETLPYGWSRDAQFSLSVINQIHSEGTVEKVRKHVFNASESDWGFASFIPLSELNSSASGFILKDTCIVEAEVKLCGLDKEEVKKKEEAEACVDNVIK